MRAAEEVPFTQWLKTQQPNGRPASTGVAVEVDTEDLDPVPYPLVAQNARARSGDGSRLCQFCLLLLAALIVPAIIIGAIRPPDPNEDRVVRHTQAVRHAH